MTTVESGGQQASLSKFDSHPYDGPINFRALFWVDRGPVIWSMQTSIAVICSIEALLMQYLTYKVSVALQGPLSRHSTRLDFLTRRLSLARPINYPTMHC